jgi:tetratricopeptide (TPR) repeat protein
VFLPKTDRKIIPRWRDFWTTAALGQLTPAETGGPRLLLPEAAGIEAMQAWKSTPSLWHALDLLSAAFVIGDLVNPDVQAAVKFLSSRLDDCPAPARQLVREILHQDEEAPSPLEVSAISSGALRDEIHTKRARLRSEPRNSILWMDLARLYTNLGERDQALRAVRASHFIAPENRFVIRAAARFLLHVGNREEALGILRASELSKSDPWIVAAEIGVSSFSGAPPRLLKLGRRMVEDSDFSEFATSELASALATVELNEGNRKVAKKLFRRSLSAPTENSVAQAEWASAQVGDLFLPNRDNVPLNYEAKMLHAYRMSEWTSAVANAKKWLSDQPFSSRPAGVLSYLYSGILGEHEAALNILNFSLVLNPGDRCLINNLAFAKINLGQLDEGDSLLNQVDPQAIDDSSTITLIATKGLLLFRRGFPSVARNLYLDAVTLAKRKGNHHYAAMASLLLAIEEIRADTDTKLASLNAAIELASKRDEPDIRHVLGRLRTMAETAHLLAPKT